MEQPDLREFMEQMCDTLGSLAVVVTKTREQKLRKWREGREE